MVTADSCRLIQVGHKVYLHARAPSPSPQKNCMLVRRAELFLSELCYAVQVKYAPAPAERNEKAVIMNSPEGNWVVNK
uniref:Uncharacterized protein n=1 Tax=Ascaris lumbricoides TaxID=6252 RepID=A0A0M3I7E9_ASCLU